MSAKELYEICQIDGKGIGLVATAFIPRGTRIICEKPLLKIQENVMHLAWESYLRLDNASKATFDKLHCYATDPDGLENISRMFLIDHSMDKAEVGKLVAEHVRVMSIFSINNFNLESGLAVYAAASRLNHSCEANAHHGYNPNIYRFTVHAVRDIAAGEEITISYMGGPGGYMVRSQRIDRLRTNYGFTCTCPKCSDNTGESDTRRELINNLCWGLGQYELGAAPTYPFVAENAGQAFAFAVMAINFMKAEGLHSGEFLTALRAASQHALTLQDWHTALEYALQEQEAQSNMLGTEVQDLVQKGAAASCWIEKVRGTVKEVLGNKQANKLLAKHDGKLMAAALREVKRREDDEKKVAKKAAQNKAQKTAKRARAAREREEQARAKEEASEGFEEHDARKSGSPRDAGKQAEANSWAKVAAGGGAEGFGQDGGWPALGKENGVGKSPAL